MSSIYSRSIVRQVKKKSKLNIACETRFRKCIFVFGIVVMTFFTCVKPVFASDLEKTITDLEKQQKQTEDAIKNLKEQQQDVKENVSELTEKSQDLQQVVSEYAGQMNSINGEIETAKAALEATSAEIISLNVELEEAHAKEAESYAILQKCIQAAYENKNHISLVFSILTSSDIKEFFSKAEYVTQMLSYEQRLIESYHVIEEEIKTKTETLNQKQDELDSYQNTLDSKQAELSVLAENAQSELADANSDLQDEKSKLKEFENELASLDKKMKNLEAKTAEAQVKLAKQIAEAQAAMAASGKKEDMSGSYAANASELEWLAATIQTEADGESYNGKLAVGTVIMNRVKSSKFPNSIVAVITQNMQFASYRSGKVELIIQRGPNATCMQAAQEVINGARVGEYLFFMTKPYADMYGIAEYTMIGNHAFFYTWKTKTPEPAPSENAEQPSEQQTNETDNQSEQTEPAPEPTPEPVPEPQGEPAPESQPVE